MVDITRPEGARRPTVSVGLPVYNGERYLEQAIDSLLAQTFEDFELIISDNGSTDGTQEIARACLAQDERVRYVRVAENRGVVWNFNEVFRQSRGEFFKPAAHDDLHAPDFIGRCVEAFREAPSSVVLVYPRTQLIDDTGAATTVYDDRLDLRQRAPSERLKAYLWNVQMVNPYFGLHRRDVYASTRLMRPFISSDVVLLAELALRGEFWELPEPLFFRRDHAGRSERAHADQASLARWYDPATTDVVGRRRSKQFEGLLRAVVDAPLPLGERVRCLRVVVRGSGLRWRRAIASELKQLVVSSVRRRSRR
jgi:glycosyltransferase involved in cell wall biosynthesis